MNNLETTNTTTAATVREKSVRELALERPQRTRHTRRPPPVMSAAQRAHNLSEEHIAMLRENIRTYRERNGGKVATTRGVPKGWGGKANRKLRDRIIAKAEGDANTILGTLIDRGVVQKDNAGNAVLAWAIGLVIARDEDTGRTAYTTKDRLDAARMVLDYTLPKPMQGRGVMQTAEGYLGALLGSIGAAPWTCFFS
jgi:hypothetical protein